MKILVICQYYYPEQFRINDICEELIKKNNEITVLTGLPNYPSGIVPKEYKFFRKRKEKINGVNVIRCWEIGRRKGNIFRILNYISYVISASFKILFFKNDYDCVYVYQLSPVTMAIPGILYKKKSKKKLHLYCLDLWPASLTAGGISNESKFYKLMQKVSKWIYNNADNILITSTQFEEYLRAELKITNKPIVYIPQYAESIFKQNSQKTKTEGTTNFMFAGNIGEAQSVETIIKAANELKEEDIKIHIVGEGSSLETCKKMGENLKLKNVIFYGRRPIEEMDEFYQKADAMLVTLNKDKILSMTLPGKVQSYMAAGKPIIGAIGGETKKTINKAECGYCVEAEDYKGLAAKMKKFINSTVEEKRKMANNSKAYYEQNFSKDQFLQQLLKILKGENKDV